MTVYLGLLSRGINAITTEAAEVFAVAFAGSLLMRFFTSRWASALGGFAVALAVCADRHPGSQMAIAHLPIPSAGLTLVSIVYVCFANDRRRIVMLLSAVGALSEILPAYAAVVSGEAFALVAGFGAIVVHDAKTNATTATISGIAVMAVEMLLWQSSVVATAALGAMTLCATLMLAHGGNVRRFSGYAMLGILTAACYCTVRNIY